MQYFGENGIIERAQRAQEIYQQAEQEEQEQLGTAQEKVDYYLNNIGNDGISKGPNGKPLVTELTKVQSSSVKSEDKNGNPITVPGGFKVRKDLGDSVQDGIVIEDEQGNQFVWIPVSNTSKDGNNLVTLDDGAQTEIVLGRYAFNTESGASNLKQKGSEYTSTITITDELGFGFKELNSYQESVQSSGTSGTNTTAKDLSGFVSSVSSNHGYYIARYEASFGSGSSVDDWKPLSQASASNSTSSMVYTKGTLWNFITQGNAAKVSQNMYVGNEFVTSDIVNSYAWDTAIVYIQAMGNSKYACATGASNTTILNTGETTDKKCNIYDMAGNLREWTTETSSVSVWSCVPRGGYYNTSSYYTSYRDYQEATTSESDITFRTILYINNI